ncbi:MAG TPA: hypothetical protein VF317_13195 [Dermatophilaceae bacterium]
MFPGQPGDDHKIAYLHPVGESDELPGVGALGRGDDAPLDRLFVGEAEIVAREFVEADSDVGV